MISGNNSEDEMCGPAPKKIKTEWSKTYSDKALVMMQKMGYKNDKGLGKANQGRLEPIEAVHQDGRKGFGLKLENISSSQDQWDELNENYSMPEKVSWICKKTSRSYSSTELKKWLKTGPKKLSLDGETLFCEPDILQHILDSKSLFDNINENDLRRARSRSNPFETIRSSIFLNRAAVKMANIDSMLEFMFTDPKDEDGNPVLNEEDLLYFADICSGPGGFSEYVLHRKSWEAKGFGFTLRGNNDFKLDKFFAGPPESFDPYYGERDDGDIFYENNQDSFANYIHKHCEKGVHFVMADGGFSVEGQENIQEILSKQLYLCQCLTALKILRPGGNFLCKLFDIFTQFSVGLIFLMYNCFNEISIIKPNSSRPANSERYLICKHKKNNTDEICDYLNIINNALNDDEVEDIVQIVDIKEIYDDKPFLNYITESNNEIGKYQVIGLRKILAYCKNSQLKETRQIGFRKTCLSLWKLPDKLRQPPELKTTEKFLEDILGSWNDKFLTTPPFEMLSTNDLSSRIYSVLDWYFVPIGRGEIKQNTCSMFLCKSRGQLLRQTETKNWEPVDSIFEIPPKSLFFGEIVYEYCGEGRTQTRVSALHIIDAVMLGGIDVRRKKISERNMLCQKFSSSINKPYKNSRGGTIRAKILFKLQNVSKFFDEMRNYTLKDNSTRLGFSLYPNKFFVPGGLLLFPKLTINFISKISRTTNMVYYSDKTKNTSYYKQQLTNEIQQQLYESFRNSFERRLLWKWTNIHQVEKVPQNDSSTLCRYDVENFVKS